MSTKLLNGIAVLFMFVAIALVAAAISATTQRSEIQGPSALAVLPDGSIWLSVEDAMWRLDENGKRVAIVDGATLGVGGRVGNLVVHPNGQVVAQVRNDATLYFLDPATGVVKSRLVPQWQADLERDSSDAINYAFDGDGRVAIANGGGHAVALFDPSGRFLARTKPGTYHFTNGLWWSSASLWTTDTNRQELVELDGNTLEVKSRIALYMHTGNWQFLGMAAASHGKESEKTHAPALATLVRFANGMTKGHATDVFADGSQMDYPVIGGTPEPRDIKWRGDELMMVDNASFAIKRYTSDRKPLPDFGDAQTQAELNASLERRNTLGKEYDAFLAGAILVFLAGLAIAMRAQWRQRAATMAALDMDLSQLGTPALPPLAVFEKSIKLFWPMILGAIVFLAFLPLASDKPVIPGLSPAQSALLGIIIVPLAYVVGVILQLRILRRNAQDPELEAIFNLRALQFLRTSDVFWKLRLPGELPQETLILGSGARRANWLVLTNHRLLVFVFNLKDRTLAAEYPRKDIERLYLLEPGEMSPGQKLLSFMAPAGTPVRMDIRGGAALKGFATCAQTARRTASQLQEAAQAAPSIDDMHQMQAEQAMPRLAAYPLADAKRHAIASLAVPGLGQWMQRRTGTAFFFFIAWLSALTTAVPVAWTLWTRLSEVSTPLILFAAGAYIFICALACMDAWTMRERFDVEGK